MMTKTALLALALLLAPAPSVTYITVSFSPDGRHVVTTGAGTAVRVWELSTGKEVRELAPRSGPGSRAIYVPDGRILLAGDKDGKIRLLSATGAPGDPIGDCQEPIPWTTLSPDGKRVAFPSGKVIEVRDLVTGTALRRITTGVEALWSCAFGPEGKTLAVACSDRTVRLWSLESGSEFLKIQTREQATAVAISPDGKTIACGTDAGILTFWDAAQGSWKSTLSHPGAVLGLAYASDGKKLASVSLDGTTRIWDPAAGREVRRLAGGLSTVVFSPDGRTLAAGGDAANRIVWIWDADTGKELQKLKLP